MENKLVQLAKDNAPVLKESVEKFASSNPSQEEAIALLRVAVDSDKQVSINLSLEALETVLREEYKNVFELGLSPDEIKAKYNINGIDFYGRLMAFVDEFDPDRSIKYGALNLGNMGLQGPAFGGGKTCLFIDPSHLESLEMDERIACLGNYSLHYYDRHFQRSEKLARETSLWSNISDLVLLKSIEKGVLPKSESELRAQVSNYYSPFEILLFGPLKNDSIQTVAIEIELHDHLLRIQELVQGIKKGSHMADALQNIDEMDLLKYHVFQQISGYCNYLGISIKPLPCH